MSFDSLIDDDVPQDSWAEAIRDLQARQIAIVHLLIAKGAFTEEEFQRDRTHWARQLDEERTRRIDQQQATAAERRQLFVRQLYSRLADFEDFQQVDIFRALTPDIQGETGVIIVRIISSLFTGASPQSRHDVFQQRLFGFRLAEEKILPILLTQEEKATSVASLQFDMMIEMQGLTELD